MSKRNIKKQAKSRSKKLAKKTLPPIYQRQMPLTAKIITALVIGVFLHISTVILFESSEGHKFNLRKLLVIIVGIVIAYFL